MQNISEPDVYSVVGDINTRVRILESKYTVTRDRLFIINQNMIDHYKKLISEIKSIRDDLKELKESTFIIRETARSIVKEMDSFARKDNLKVLEKYINMWNPLEFVTENEVIDLIKEHKHGKSSHR